MHLLSRCTRIAAAAAIVALVASLAPRHAEAQTVSACYTKKNGTMYRVGEPNTPADCTSSAHVKETWNVQGPQGPAGPAGSGGLLQISYSSEAIFTVQPGYTHLENVMCPEGYQVIGGQWRGEMGHIKDIAVTTSEAHYTYTGWSFYVHNSAAFAQEVRVRAVCIRLS
jgi:hypothetical protein